jgi:soluble lytic murein transglycosylase
MSMPPSVLRRRRGLSAIAACALLSCVGCGEPAPPPPVAPTILATIYPTPTPLATATPIPQPTPDLVTLREEANRAAFIGDYVRAIALGQEMLKFAEGAAADARLKLGQWQLAAGDARAAVAVLQPLTAELDGNRGSELADAHVLLGRAYATIGDSRSAGAGYAAALAAGAVISPWLHLWLGDISLNAGELADAAAHYQRSLDGVPTVAQEFARREKLALAHQLAGDYSAAVKQYETILARAQLPAYRARITWELAQVLQASGQVGRAHQLMRALIEAAPKTPQALQAARALLNAGQAVDDLQYGIVAYHNGSHVAAREAFRRAIGRDPSRANDVRYWAALNYIKLGSVSDALRNLDQTIAANSASAPATIQALGEKAKILANAGNAAQAQAAFGQLIARATASLESSRTMLEVGQVFARYPALWAEAAQAYIAAADSQTGDQSLAAEGLIRAAAMYFRLGRHSDALTLVQRLRSAFDRAPQSLLGRLWEGKLRLILGDEAGGVQVLRDLASEAPDAFEGARAAELLLNPEQPPLSANVRAALGQADEAGAQEEAERWLRGWLGLDERADLRTLRADLAADPRFSRGSALWRLGFRVEAREEFDGLRLAFGRDALAQYQLALFFRQIGLYRASISAADALMRLSPAKGPSDLPTFIGKLLYPTYYAELVMKHAEEFGLDPLLLFALIRQESLFEPFAVSSAAANGLMQVIPSTGREIHAELGWPANYTTADLQKPYVSVRFGSYYLAKQRRFFNGDLYAALAAYNGGPGNALRWRERSAGDPDLFYMFITFDETQRYIRALAANYAIYHRLYGRP